jgi:hypothetical protein
MLSLWMSLPFAGKQRGFDELLQGRQLRRFEAADSSRMEGPKEFLNDNP